MVCGEAAAERGLGRTLFWSADSGGIAVSVAFSERVAVLESLCVGFWGLKAMKNCLKIGSAYSDEWYFCRRVI